MSSWRRIRPSPAMIVAVIALIAGLGGGAIGATLITGAQTKDSSVTGADIRDKPLAGKDLKDSSVTGVLVRNGSLQANDLSARLPGRRFAPGVWRARLASRAPRGHPAPRASRERPPRTGRSFLA